MISRFVPALASLYHYEKTMESTTRIGLIASTLTRLAAIPELIKICKERKAENISLLWIVSLFPGLCGWIYNGIPLKN
jgi:uncharacterized protein with PQ loop repeat